MRLPLKEPFGIVVFATLIALSSMVFAQEQYTLTPSISVSETYDDNIFLENETLAVSDWITAVTPGIALDVQTPRHWLQLNYAPSIVRYRDFDVNDTVRHLGNILYHQDVTKDWRFDLTNTYIRSEEPLETTPGVEGVRTDPRDRVRNPYQRNIGEAKVSYLFGREDMFSGGYRNNLLINDDITVDDGTIHEPFADYIQWFDQKHGMALSYRYIDANFTSDDPNRLAQPDYTGHSPELRYLHRFDPQTSGSVGYVYSSRDFDQNTFRQDYTVHTATAGLEKNFDPQTYASATLGYFIRDTEELGRLPSDTESGPNFNLYLRRIFQRGSLFLGGAGGWDEQYLEAENRGFVEFWSVEAGVDYALLQPLTFYASGIYRDEKDENDVQTNTWRGSVGLRWAFHRYFSMALDYTHVSRDSDREGTLIVNGFVVNDIEDYESNRVMLILTGLRPIRW
jgi:hypothetical protein